MKKILIVTLSLILVLVCLTSCAITISYSEAMEDANLTKLDVSPDEYVECKIVRNGALYEDMSKFGVLSRCNILFKPDLIYCEYEVCQATTDPETDVTVIDTLTREQYWISKTDLKIYSVLKDGSKAVEDITEEEYNEYYQSAMRTIYPENILPISEDHILNLNLNNSAHNWALKLEHIDDNEHRYLTEIIKVNKLDENNTHYSQTNRVGRFIAYGEHIEEYTEYTYSYPMNASESTQIPNFIG